ncbi:MAG: UDP-N-acetylmuramoyl-L-alanine--D-glutamate ligase, partial [Anaerolineales bacterium]
MADVPSSVVILGLARQGAALARFFAARGAEVTISDIRPADKLEAAMAALEEEGLSLRYVLGEHPPELLDDCDLLCLSGGIPLDLPIVAAARARGISLSNDAQEFVARCPAPIVGITGSAGKTTTTTLVGKMLEAEGFTTWVGGNIGNPLLNELLNIDPDDRVVMELSSFQLDLMSVSPEVAGVLNITPNHLDRHKTMAAYVAAKRNIVAHQGPEDVAVLGYDEPNARALAASTPAAVRYFSGADVAEADVFLRDDTLMLRRSEGADLVEVCARESIQLRGSHNVLNVLAAIALADAVGASVGAMREAIGAFTGVAHRLEVVRRWCDALWVNDSIATAPERVIAALDAFDEPIILLAGGRDKDLEWEALARRIVERVRILITFGEVGPLIREHVLRAWVQAQQEGVPVTLMESVPVGPLLAAVQAATARARPGEVVLLSPGGTSFDAFTDFAERGEYFRALVEDFR